MHMTELQYASLVISLSTLGQTDLAGNDTDGLRTLEYLLEQALENVRRTLGTDARQRHQIEQQNEDREGWLNMSNGEEVP